MPDNARPTINLLPQRLASEGPGDVRRNLRISMYRSRLTRANKVSHAINAPFELIFLWMTARTRELIAVASRPIGALPIELPDLLGKEHLLLFCYRDALLRFLGSSTISIHFVPLNYIIYKRTND